MQKRKEWLQCADIEYVVTISILQSFANSLQKGGKGVFFTKLRYLCVFRLLVKRHFFCTDIEEEQELNREHLIVFFCNFVPFFA